MVRRRRAVGEPVASKAMTDSIPTLDVEDDDVVYVAVGAAGVAGFTPRVDRRLTRAPFARARIGRGRRCLLARRKLTERNEKIDSAATAIRSELDDLDPVARAQVLADIAQSEL